MLTSLEVLHGNWKYHSNRYSLTAGNGSFRPVKTPANSDATPPILSTEERIIYENNIRGGLKREGVRDDGNHSTQKAFNVHNRCLEWYGSPMTEIIQQNRLVSPLIEIELIPMKQWLRSKKLFPRRPFNGLQVGVHSQTIHGQVF